MFYPYNLTRSNENMTIRSPIPRITVLTTDARQPWMDLQGCYSGYLIIYFNYLMIFFDNLTIGYNKTNFHLQCNWSFLHRETILSPSGHSQQLNKKRRLAPSTSVNQSKMVLKVCSNQKAATRSSHRQV